MYDDQHAYTTKPGSLKNIQLNTNETSASEVQLEKTAEEWTKSKNAKISNDSNIKTAIKKA
jgi:hypothetical protein